MPELDFEGKLEPQLERFLKHWLDEQIGKLTRTIIIGAVVFAFGVGVAYTNTQSRIAQVEREVQKLDETGTRYEKTLREDIIRLQTDMASVKENIQDIRYAICGEGPCRGKRFP